MDSAEQSSSETTINDENYPGVYDLNQTCPPTTGQKYFVMEDHCYAHIETNVPPDQSYVQGPSRSVNGTENTHCIITGDPEEPLQHLDNDVEMIECSEEEIPPDIDLSSDDLSLEDYFTMLEKNGCGYVAGYIARQVTTSKRGPSKGCSFCEKVFIGTRELNDHTIFLSFKEYCHARRKGLFYPSKNLYESVKQCGILFDSLFLKVCHQASISKLIALALDKVTHDWCSCPLHGSSSWSYLVNLLVKLKMYPKVRDISKEVCLGYQRKRGSSDSHNAKKKLRKL